MRTKLIHAKVGVSAVIKCSSVYNTNPGMYITRDIKQLQEKKSESVYSIQKRGCEHSKEYIVFV